MMEIKSKIESAWHFDLESGSSAKEIVTLDYARKCGWYIPRNLENAPGTLIGISEFLPADSNYTFKPLVTYIGDGKEAKIIHTCIVAD